MEEQPDFCTLLNHYLVQRFHRTRGGAQLIASAVNQRFEKLPIPWTTIRNWLQGAVTNPQQWWHVSAVASVLCETTGEADQLLLSAGHMTLGDKRNSGVLIDEEREVLGWWEQFAKAHPLKLLFSDDFADKSLNLMLWNEEKSQHVSIHDGSLWFDVPTNTRGKWYADILETRLMHHDYFVRIEFSVYLASLPSLEIGYLGVQTDCDRGWLLVYIGESDPGLIVEYSREAEKDLDYRGAFRQKVASVSFNQYYKVELVWEHSRVTILLDGTVCAVISSVPSRYFNLNAGVRPGMAVCGAIKDLRVWCAG